MTTDLYKVSEGHDVAEMSLTTLDPQPTSTGIQAMQRVHSGSGDVYEDGLYIELNYPLVEGEDEYMAILEDYGLDNAYTAEVTVYVRDQRWVWGRYNGTAVLPEQGRDVRWTNYFGRDLTILVRDLEPVS